MIERTFFATTPKGMTDLLATEVREFGAIEVTEGRAGTSFRGSLEVAYRACLWSRVANRILLPIARFTAADDDALYRETREIDWSEHVSDTGTIAVDANVSASNITHSHFAALRIKDAIVDQFTAATGHRPSVNVDRPDVRVNCYLDHNQAELYLDLSGTSLHQRGYRLAAGEAPLKENLAAAILLRAGWSQIALDGGAFVDPMCGSGTLVLEAAMIAGDIAPGLSRDYFGFLEWRQHDEVLFARLREEAVARRGKGMDRLPPLMGFDRDRRVLDRARDNAMRLGLEDETSFAYQDMANFRHDFPASGLLATNPPYGKRIAASGELPALYRALGELMKTRLAGWRAAVFTEDAALGKEIGIRARRLHTLYNGAIACKLIHFEIDAANFFRDDRLPRRISDDELSPQSMAFRNRLEKNLRQLRRWAKREGVDCFRVYDADLPDYAAAIDVYSHAELPDTPWICVQEYEAPREIDERKAKRRLREIRTQVQDVFNVDDDHLFIKTRSRQRGERQYERQEEDARFTEVTEGRCRFLVNFETYLDTGLFLDHRPIRERIEVEAAGKSFLNLFCYTGAATVHAAMGGASATTSVDMSRTYLDWAGRNLAINGFDDPAHELVQSDCIKWLEASASTTFDIVFLDPPTFSNSKRMRGPLDIQRDHARLVRLSADRLAPDGTMYFSTNLRGFRIDHSLEADFTIEDISKQSIPFDFRRRLNIHHCFRIRHRS